MALLLMVCLFGCSPKLQRFEFTRLEMGVKARVVTYAASMLEAQAGAGAAFGRLADLDACMSDYRPQSELMRLCAQPPGQPVTVSTDLFEVLETAQQISHDSGGTFDVTVGPAVALWRDARKAHDLPARTSIAGVMARVGSKYLALDADKHTATLLRPDMRLDLGGIAKGYAAEQAVIALRAKGQAICLVALAGDIFAGDPPPGQQGWTIELAINGRSLLLGNEAASTSGDTEQFIELGGKRYSHIIDPRTGMAMTTRVQATVVARHGAIADAVSTAVSVLGPEAGAELASREGAALVAKQGDMEPLIEDESYPLRWAPLRWAPLRWVDEP